MKQDTAMAVIAMAVVGLIGVSVVLLNILFPPPDIQMPQGPVNLSWIPDGAKVEIIEFSDFECPFCVQASRTVNQLKEMYAEHIEVDFRHYPGHRESQKAAEASECARDQGAFWEYHDLLFKTRDLDSKSLKKHAEELNLDMTLFLRCLDGSEKAGAVRKDFEEGKSIGVRGTPTFFINGQVLEGAQPIAKFRKVIDEQLKAVSE